MKFPVLALFFLNIWCSTLCNAFENQTSVASCLFMASFSSLALYGHFACMDICTLHRQTPDAHRGQRAVLASLGLELEKVVSCCVSDGNQTWALWKSKPVLCTDGQPHQLLFMTS